MSTLKANTIQPINAATGLVLRTNEVDRLNINTSGDVGIGVSPSYKLHVSGTCAIVPNTNVGMRIYEDTDTANFLRFRPLSSTGSQTGFMFSGDDDSPHLTINYTSLVSGSPRIGIGTASPAVALDVNGTIKTDTALVLGGATFAAPSGTAPIFGVRAWVTFCGILDINGIDDSANQGNYNLVTSYPSGHSPNRKIIASGNVSSVTLTRDPRDLTKYATGVYTVNFTTPLPSSSTNFRTTPSYNRAATGAPITGAAITDATLYGDIRSPYYQKNGTPLGAYAVAGFSNEMYGNLWYGNYNFFTAGSFWDWNACLPDKCIVIYNNEDTLGACVPGNTTLIFVG